MADDFDPAPLDPEAAAEELRQSSEQRLLARYRHGRPALGATPEAPAPEPEPPSDDTLPSDLLPSDRHEAADGEVPLEERARLNSVNSYYRGTLLGSTRLAMMARDMTSPEPEGMAPETRRMRDSMHHEYENVIADLARYDMMRPWGTTLEAAAAFGGQVGGSLLSPESFLGAPAKGATWLGRTIKAAFQQGAIQAVVDPAIQYLNNQGGVQQGYDPWRTVAAGGLGAIIGGGLHIAGEGFSALLSNAGVGRLRAQLAKEDHAFAGDLERQFAAEDAAEPKLPSDAAEEKISRGETPEPLPVHERAPPAELLPEIDNTHDVVSGAVASKDPNGPVYVDKHIPELSPKLKDANGQPANLHKYLAVHETEERAAMARGMSYEDAHNNVATPAERAAVEADGVDWKAYTKEIDGFLDHVETEKEANPPPDPHIDPDKAIIGDTPHHHSHAKEEAAAPAEGDELAALTAGGTQPLAQRRGGGLLPMEQRRAPGGTPAQGTAVTPQTGTAVAAVPQPSPAQASAIRSLQQQAFDLADAIGFPLRQGRVGKSTALGTFNLKSGVVRVKEAPDFEVVAHEAGHAIEAKGGQALTALTQQFRTELAPLVSNPAQYPPAKHVTEGFAEYIRRRIGNPAHANQVAPGFNTAFNNFLASNHPEILKAIDDASTAYQAYLRAPSVDVVASVIRSMTEDPDGWRGVVKDIRDRGLPATIGTMVQNAYTKLLDDKAPVARAVRELAGFIKEADPNHALVRLKAADNPDVLLRLAGRSQQAAIHDMMDGTYGYHQTTASGPSLTQALTHATGQPTFFGKWDDQARQMFSAYLIARRAEYLWRKHEAGDLANPPAAFSKADAVTAMAELEAQNPTFRQASDMVHGYTRVQLDKALDAGLIDSDLHGKLMNEDFYVPFMRDLSDRPLAAEKPGSSSEGPGMTAIVKKIKGSSRDIIDPIESIMMQTFLLNRTIQHNDVIRSFVRLADQAGTEGGNYVEKIPAHEAKKYTFDLGDVIERKAIEKGMLPNDAKMLAASMANQFGEDPLMGSFFRQEAAGKRGEPIVFYKEGGTLKAARFMSEDEGHALYEALTFLPQKMNDVWADLISGASAITRTGIISSPTFALSNYIRDQVAVGILQRGYIPIASGLKGIKAEFTQGEAAKLYAIGGGVAPGSSISPVEKAIEADVNALAKKGYLVNRVTSLKGALELAAFSEAGTRNSVFKTVFDAKKAQGLSDYEAMIEAAYTSTDLLDFSRHGSRTLAIRNYLPFINAHFQGIDKAYRTMVQPVIDKLRGNQVFSTDSEAFNNAIAAWVKAGGVGMVLGAGWSALNQDSEAYRDASPYLKGTHIVVPFGNKVFLVPKPFELGIGFTAGEFAFHRWAQDDPRAAGTFVNAAWQALEPPNPFGGIPLLSTIASLQSGKDIFFTGNDIVPDRLQRLPPAQQYTDRTSSIAKFIGSEINVSPMKVDYGIGSMFGNMGRDAMTLSSAFDPKKPAQNWEDYVFARRFIKDPTRTSDVTTRFWNYMSQTSGQYNQDVNGYDNLIRLHDDAGAAQFLNNLPPRERAFVIMKSAADEDGKPAFKSDEKRLHPLQRAYDAITLLNGLSRELSDNNITKWETKDRLPLGDRQRRDLLDNVRELKQMEMRNAFVIMKEPGYEGRALLDTQPTLAKIGAVSPQVSDEIATRYATAKIYTTDAVAKAYPSLEREMLQNGSEGYLGDLAADAKAEGYEFGGEKARRPPKRRIPIPATAAPAMQQ